MRLWAAALLLVTLPSPCTPWRDPPRLQGDPRFGVEVVSDEGIQEFHQRANGFYARLAGRRFNSYATYNDRVLRDYFRDEQQYSDYYAEMAQALVEAHFEKNRPLVAVVQEFTLDGPGEARVRFRMEGANGLPLRPGGTAFEREDRWERTEGQWWIVPGKL